jgi:hypothetical protein
LEADRAAGQPTELIWTAHALFWSGELFISARRALREGQLSLRMVYRFGCCRIDSALQKQNDRGLLFGSLLAHARCAPLGKHCGVGR